jgi:hypothetical protein
MQVRRERGIESAPGGGAGEFPDQRVGTDEARLVPVLDRAIGNGDREM